MIALGDRNYLPRLVRTHARLLRRGVVQWGEVLPVEVRHDAWCPILAGAMRCTCNPELWLDGRRVD